MKINVNFTMDINIKQLDDNSAKDFLSQPNTRHFDVILAMLKETFEDEGIITIDLESVEVEKED